MYMIGSGSVVGTNPFASLNSSGDMGIGTGSTTPAARLEVYDDTASGYTAKIFNDGNNANRWGLVIQAGADTGGTGTLIQFHHQLV